MFLFRKLASLRISERKEKKCRVYDRFLRQILVGHLAIGCGFHFANRVTVSSTV